MNSKEKKKILSWLEDPERTAKQGKKLYAEFGRKQYIHRTINRLQVDDKIISILDVQFKMMLGLSVLPPQVDADPVKEEDKKPDPSDRAKILKTKDLEVPEDLKQKELHDPFPEEKRPAELLGYYNEKNECYVVAKNLHSQLVAKGDEMDKHEEGSDEYKALADERKPMAEKIISLFDNINIYWKQIDYYAAHGKLPEPEDLEKKPDIKADDEDPIALDRRWRTLGSYISKAKKKPERNQEKFEELFAESNAIAAKLNAIAGEEKYKMRKHETPPDSKKEK